MQKMYKIIKVTREPDLRWGRRNTQRDDAAAGYQQPPTRPETYYYTFRKIIQMLNSYNEIVNYVTRQGNSVKKFGWNFEIRLLLPENGKLLRFGSRRKSLPFCQEQRHTHTQCAIYQPWMDRGERGRAELEDDIGDFCAPQLNWMIFSVTFFNLKTSYVVLLGMKHAKWIVFAKFPIQIVCPELKLRTLCFSSQDGKFVERSIRHRFPSRYRALELQFRRFNQTDTDILDILLRYQPNRLYQVELLKTAKQHLLLLHLSGRRNSRDSMVKI